MTVRVLEQWSTGGDAMLCWVAQPVDTPPRAAVVVLPELFGITEHVIEVCRQLAQNGYGVTAPDVFHRVPGATTLSEDDEGRARGFELLATITAADVNTDVEAATAIAVEGNLELTGVVGISVGGYLAYRVATRLVFPTCVLLYPGWLDTHTNPLGDGVRALDDLSTVRGDILIITGDADHLVTATSRAHIAEAFAQHTTRHQLQLQLDVLPRAGHGYLAPHRSTHNTHAADATWRMLLDHLGRY